MIYDAAVIGAGPAGSVAALILAATGHSVLLIDPLAKTRKRIGEALPASAKPLLDELALLELVERDAHVTSYGNASAWMTEHLEITDFLQHPLGLGWHLDRAKFDAMLRQEACSSGASLCSQRLRSLEPITGEAAWLLAFKDKHVKCRWLIDASGRVSFVAQKLGISRIYDDELRAIYTWIPSKEEDEGTQTLIESIAEGWWYTARLPDATRVISLHVDADLAKAIRQKPELWRSMLRETFYIKETVAVLPEKESLRFADASSSRLTHMHGPGWLACGDSAMSFDPLSSQGILNALFTGTRAGQAVVAALMGHDDAPSVYAKRLDHIWQHFITQQRLVYGVVTRWHDQPFWQRRTLENHSAKKEKSS